MRRCGCTQGGRPGRWMCLHAEGGGVRRRLGHVSTPCRASHVCGAFASMRLLTQPCCTPRAARCALQEFFNFLVDHAHEEVLLLRTMHGLVEAAAAAAGNSSGEAHARPALLCCCFCWLQRVMPAHWQAKWHFVRAWAVTAA